MTVVVGFGVNRIPVILADLLLSGDEENRRVVRLPTVGWRTNVFPTGSGFVPLGLCQKINIIGKNLAIGWAGRKIYAQRVIRDLKRMGQTQKLDKEILNNYFDDLDKNDNSFSRNVQFYGLVTDAVGISPFWYGGNYFESSILGRVTLLGSGSEDIYEFLKRNQNLPKRYSGMNDSEYALSYALSVSGFLLLSEIRNMDSLKHYYGGGYEIVMFNDGEFQKVGDISFVFWNSSIHGKKVNLGLYKIIKLSYGNHLMFLQVASPGGDGPDFHISKSNFGLYIVPPIDRTVVQQEISALRLPELNSKYTCHFIIYDKGNNNLDVIARIEKTVREEKRTFSIEHKYPALIINLTDRFWSDLKSEILNID